jgi:hypothetical protein
MVITIAAMQCSTAWSETKVFQLSVTIPSVAFLATPQNNQNKVADQIKQTQQLIRDNKMVTVSSIVVP